MTGSASLIGSLRNACLWSSVDETAGIPDSAHRLDAVLPKSGSLSSHSLLPELSHQVY